MIYYADEKPSALGMQSYFDRKPIGTLDVLGATAEQTLYYNPLNAMVRRKEQFKGEGTRGRVLSKEEFQESPYFREGIEVGDDGITEGLAKLLSERQDKRDRINFQLSRSPGGFGLGAAQFGTTLLVSMLDPINIGTAFIPGGAAVQAGKAFGQARLVSMAAKAKTTRGRLARGGTEGAVGAALVEPVIISQASMEYDSDYGLMDGLINVAVGGILGGGLHAGFGKISDRIEAANQKRKDQAFELMARQAVADQEVNVERFIPNNPTKAKQDVEERLAAMNEYSKGVIVKETAVDPETGEVRLVEAIPEGRVPAFDEPPALDKKGRARPPMLRVAKPLTLLQFIRREGGISSDDPNVGDILDSAKGPKGKVDTKLINKKGRSLDDMLTRAREEGYIDEAPLDAPDDMGINQLIDLMAEDKFSGEVFSRFDGNEVDAFRNAEKLIEEADARNIDYMGMTDEQFNTSLMAAMEAEEYASLVSSAPDAAGVMSEEEFAAAIDEARSQDVQLGAMSEYSDFLKRLDESGVQMQTQELAAINAENDALTIDLDRHKEQGNVSDEMIAYVDEAAELEQKAESIYRKIARAAASCVIGRGRV